ncbi:MAG: site-specific DNA-methyltransferase [Crocinitomicaceae bacterium]
MSFRQDTESNMEENTTNNIKAQNQNIEVLKKHFGQCFDKRGNFDFDKFKQELTENEIDFYKESYGLDWLGKSYARVLASDPVTTLLKEDAEHNQKEANKNSENIFIKGDNLEVLKHLSNAYYEKIKMIYIDPPYNTGSDGFVYQDDRKFTIKELTDLAGVTEEKAKRILDFTQSNSNSHSAWLTFMYPRLYVAKQLLGEDGVIFISIDDNEITQLRMLMDEIFGEENFIASLAVQLNPRGRNLDKFIAKTHEHILVFTKNSENLTSMKGLEKEGDMVKEYNRDDEDGKGAYRLIGLRNRNQAFNPTTRPKLYYPLFVDPENGSVSLKKSDIHTVEILPDTNDGVQTCWTWGKDKVKNENNLLVAEKSDSNFRIYRKDYLLDEDGNAARTLPKSIWLDKEINNDFGKQKIKNLFKKNLMSFPKSTFLIEKLMKFASDRDSIVLDFFAGSATTAQAVMELNVKDGGNRKCISVQLPELCDEKSDAYKAGYKTIAELAKERIKRAANKIQEDHKDQDLSGYDLGFKAFEIEKIWDDYGHDESEMNVQTKLFDETKLSNEDIKALLVTWKVYDGSMLTEQTVSYDLGGYNGYYVINKLYLMEKGFSTNNLTKLLEKIDSDKNFNPTSIIAFGYHFNSKNLREISENIKSYANKKNIDIDFITRY